MYSNDVNNDAREHVELGTSEYLPQEKQKAAENTSIKYTSRPIRTVYIT